MANIKALRKAAGMTQEQLAERLGVGRTTVTMWETSDTLPQTRMLIALADALGCTVEDLLKPA